MKFKEYFYLFYSIKKSARYSLLYKIGCFNLLKIELYKDKGIYSDLLIRDKFQIIGTNEHIKLSDNLFKKLIQEKKKKPLIRDDFDTYNDNENNINIESVQDYHKRHPSHHFEEENRIKNISDEILYLIKDNNIDLLLKFKPSIKDTYRDIVEKYGYYGDYLKKLEYNNYIYDLCYISFIKLINKMIFNLSYENFMKLKKKYKLHKIYSYWEGLAPQIFLPIYFNEFNILSECINDFEILKKISNLNIVFVATQDNHKKNCLCSLLYLTNKDKKYKNSLHSYYQ